MGAVTFFTVSHAPSASAAFESATSAACHTHGDHGYTGTIAEKDDYVVVHDAPPLPIPDAEKLANELINKQDPRIDNKWGPAGAIRLVDGWLFFGWAST